MPDGSNLPVIPPRGSGGGGGGGKGGGSSQPTEAKNTLRAKMKVRVLYAISEGPIVGLKTGDKKSVFFNDTQVEDPTGKANFEGVELEQRLGDAVQTPIGNFPTVEDSFQVGVKVDRNENSWPVRTVDLTNRDRLKVIVQVNSLYKVDNKGNVNPNSVDYTVQVRVAGSGSAWATWHQGTISGKCVSPYLRAHTDAVPYPGPIEIRVGRLTDDPADSKDVNELYWASYSSILDQKLSYPGTALVGITFDAQQQSGSIPTVTFDAKGLICEVPVNYDPVARTYSGVWDGTFKTAYTNNPAWVFWTLATNPEYGAGSALASGIVSPAAAYAAASGLVDRWALYSISQYCDESVPNGFGGWEPRYVFNGWIQTADEAYRVLQAIASAFRGMLYWGNGQIVPVIDRPRDAVKLVTPANIIDGLFEYQGSSMRARHSVVRVRWRDPALNYRENIAVVEDPEMMREVGVRAVDYEALGATSLSQATRMGKWVLYTEKYETGLVRYRASVDHINVVPGDVIAIQDPNKAGIAFSGRLLHTPFTTSSVQLDRDVTLSAGQSYWLRVMYSDGSLSALLPISTGPGTTDTVTLSTPLAQTVVPEAVWVIIASNVAPVTYQVMHIEEMNDETYEVTALRHYSGKYNFIEYGWSLNEPPTSLYPPTNAAMAPPTGLAVREYLTGTGTTPLVRCIFSWAGNNFDHRLIGYEAAVMQGDTVVQVLTTAENSVTFADLVAGNYNFIVRALGGSGITSAWARLNNVAVDGQSDPPNPPSALAISSGIRNIGLSWNFPDSLYRRGIEVWAVGLGFNNASDDPYASLPPAPEGGWSKLAEVDATSFIHTGLSSSHVWYYRIRTVDVFGQFSSWVGPIGARTSYLVAGDIRDGILNTAKFAASIAPVGLYSSTPGTKQEEIIYNTTDGHMYRWSAATNSYVRAVRAVDIDGQLASNQISALEAAKLIGEVLEAQIAGGAITTAKLASGAVTTAKLGVASPANWIWDSCFQGVRWGVEKAWVAQTDAGVTLDIKSSVSEAVAQGFALSAFKLGGFDTGVLRATGSPNAVRMFFAWANDGPAETSTPVKPNTKYHAAAAFNAVRCQAHINIVWRDQNGASLSEVNSSYSTFSSAGGTREADYARVTLVATSPANAAYATVRFGALLDGQATPTCYVTKTMFGESLPSATEVPPWEPGGITKISGGQIITRSIAADRIVADSITSNEISANAITANEIAANAVTFGKIAAGAVRAAEIAAGEIRATHLASETVIAETVQVANLVIGTQHINFDAITRGGNYVWNVNSRGYQQAPDYSLPMNVSAWIHCPEARSGLMSVAVIPVGESTGGSIWWGLRIGNTLLTGADGSSPGGVIWIDFPPGWSQVGFVFGGTDPNQYFAWVGFRFIVRAR